MDSPADGEQAYHRVDNITDAVLAHYQRVLDGSVTKDDIFFYVYGLLHSPHYRARFAADLKKMLPRIPVVDTCEQFFTFSRAGRALSELHAGYETADLYPLHETITRTLDSDEHESWRISRTVRLLVGYTECISGGEGRRVLQKRCRPTT